MKQSFQIIVNDFILIATQDSLTSTAWPEFFLAANIAACFALPWYLESLLL